MIRIDEVPIAREGCARAKWRNVWTSTSPSFQMLIPCQRTVTGVSFRRANREQSASRYLNESGRFLIIRLMAHELDSVSLIQAILARGAFDELIGVLENEIFEAKAEPWELNSERGKFELAKDISSVANWRGGIFVVGAATFPSATYQRREISEIRRLPKELTPSDRYWDILSEWVYPAPVGVKFSWHPDPADANVGLVSVYVPEFDDELKPFLVAHYLPEVGNRIPSAIGLFQRLGSITKPTPIQDLHAFVREGRRLDEIHQKLDTILSRIDDRGRATESEPWIRKVLTRVRSLRR